MELWYALVDLLPFEWAQPGSMYFMKNALLAVLVISPLFGILSTMVVHSRMSFFSDALGHSAFTGMAIGALCGFSEPTWAARPLLPGLCPAFQLCPPPHPAGQRHGHRRLLLHCGGTGHLHLHPGQPLLYQIQQSAHRRHPLGGARQDRPAGPDPAAGPGPVGSVLQPPDALRGPSRPGRTAAGSASSGRRPCSPPPSPWWSRCP